MDLIETHRGISPVILGFLHTGTHVPDEIAVRLNERGRLLTDTNWHIHELYAGLLPGASRIRALFHRYIIDANRDPTGASLYPGQNTTGLIPETDFDGLPTWRVGAGPNAADIAARLELYHAPYHAALSDEITRVKAEPGVAILFDCHSIRSNIPFLFSGKLPDFNIGTVDGDSCSPATEAAVAEVARFAIGFSFVLNGGFKGGWTTRHYGQPREDIHAIQLEQAQDTHLASETLPFDLDPAKASRLRQHLCEMLVRIETIAPSLAKARS